MVQFQSQNIRMCKTQKEVLQHEINEFKKHCKEYNINFQQVYENTMATLKCEDKSEKKICKRKHIIAILLLIIAIASLIYLSDSIVIHASAIGRILMVQMMPYYDWRHLKYEKCVLNYHESNDAMTENNHIVNCFYCDAITDIPVVKSDNNFASSEIIKAYWDMDAPIMVTNITPTNLNLSKLLTDYTYLDYEPCDTQSNIPLKKYSTAEDVFEKTENAPFFWFHMRNCNPQAAKLFRRHFPRPEYLHVDFSPVQQSWILLSGNLVGEQPFKELPLGDRLSVIEQVQGANEFRLRPISRCKDECIPITFLLTHGNVLIVSDLWQVEYAPYEGGQNIAIAIEAH